MVGGICQRPIWISRECRIISARLDCSHGPPETEAKLRIPAADARIGISWLEKAVEERSELVSSIKGDPIWDPLRDDPRFDDLLPRACRA